MFERVKSSVDVRSAWQKVKTGRSVDNETLYFPLISDRHRSRRDVSLFSQNLSNRHLPIHKPSACTYWKISKEVKKNELMRRRERNKLNCFGRKIVSLKFPSDLPGCLAACRLVGFYFIKPFTC